MWDLVGSGWTLVRRVKPGNTWHPSTDGLTGTDVYGKMPSAGASTSDSTFSIEFPIDRVTEFLFTTGDEELWMACTKSAIGGKITGSYYSNAFRDVLMSSADPTPHKKKWYNRQGVLEDPWLSIEDHHDAIGEGTIIYGENSYGAGHASNILP